MIEKQLQSELASLRAKVARLEAREARQSLGNELLRRLSLRLADVLDQLPIITFTCRASGDYGATFISASVNDVTGYPAEAFLSDPSFWIDRVHPDDKQQVLAALPAVLEQDRYEHEYRWRVADGSFRWFESVLRTVRDDGGEVRHLAGAWRDITERRDETQRRQQATDEALGMLAHLPVVIYTCATTGNFETTYVSPNAHRVLGYRPEQFTNDGLFWVDRIHADDKPRVVSMFTHLFGEENIEYEYRWRRGDGTWVWILDLLRLVRNADGSPSHILGAMHDITARKRNEQELHDTREEARRVSARLFDRQERSERRLAETIQDDVSQNLAAMRLDLSWLRRQMAPASASAARRVDHLLGLVDTTLDSLQGVATDLRPTVLDDLGLVPAVLSEAREVERRSDVSVSVNVEPPDLTLDRERSTAVYRMLQEALANAVQHSQARRISVDLNRDGDELRVEVRDDGRGITTEESSGEGALGLAGLRARAQVLGGQAVVRGVPGRGTTISIQLPVEPAPIVAPPPSAVLPEPDAPPGTLSAGA